jgi:tRNA dimethylallyltransferase
MIQNGLEYEARKVYALKHLKSLQTVGYREFFEYFGGKLTREQCISEIKTHTRQYAKRQVTWFNKYLPYQKVNPALSAEEIINSLGI